MISFKDVFSNGPDEDGVETEVMLSVRLLIESMEDICPIVLTKERRLLDDVASGLVLVSKRPELANGRDTVEESRRGFVFLAAKDELLTKLAPEDGNTSVVLASLLGWLILEKIREVWKTLLDV